jgi:hypothetical protein
MITMFRKTIIAIAAAATLALGLGAATAPAEAGHRRAHIGIYIGVPYVGFYGHRGHRHGHCHVYKVRKSYGWKRVKRCHSHRHYHGHH